MPVRRECRMFTGRGILRAGRDNHVPGEPRTDDKGCPSGSRIVVKPPVQVMINGRAGGMGKPETREEISGLLDAAFPGVEILFADPSTNVADWAQRAVANGATLVIGGGGDGTINSVAGAVVGSKAVLGVLPLGTLNHFAKDLGIPVELEKAVDVLTKGVVKAVDVGEVNGRVFLNNSGLGLYPSIVRIRETKQREGLSKWPAAVYATMKAMSRYRMLSLFVNVDGREIERRTPIVFVGNNEYSMDGLGLPARQGMNDGRLCLYIPHPTRRASLVRFSIGALLKNPKPGKEYDAIFATSFRIQSRHRHLSVSIDGEVEDMKTPLRFKTRPGELRVMTPLAEG
ncbi:MAG: diacylglycerol kinase family protein [Gemmatimonadota bacterium]